MILRIYSKLSQNLNFKNILPYQELFSIFIQEYSLQSLLYVYSFIEVI